MAAYQKSPIMDKEPGGRIILNLGVRKGDEERADGVREVEVCMLEDKPTEAGGVNRYNPV